jgi:hypothetical protein
VEEATRVRVEQRDIHNAALLHDLDQLIRDCNPYYAAFTQMRQVVEKERRDAAARNEPERNIVLSFVRERNVETRGRYNLPAVSEVACVFSGDEPPSNVDIRIYPRSRDTDTGQHVQGTSISMLSPNLDPMLFPRGDQGWRINIPLQGES